MNLCSAFDATLSGLGKLLMTVTQGSPALRANPGLIDGTPLGF
jgi:hypothetical protein